MIAQTQMASVLNQVANWPIQDRMVLAKKILETVEVTRSSTRYSAEEVIRLLKMPQPAPNDAECQTFLEDELLRKHGR